MKAGSNGWQFTEENCRGGRRRTYPIDQLPEELATALRDARGIIASNVAAQALASARAAGAAEGAALVLMERIDSAACADAREHGMTPVAALQGKGRTRMERRLLLVALFERYYVTLGGDLTPAQRAFVLAWREGKIDADADLLAAYPKLSASTIDRWQDWAKTEGARRLAGRHGNRRGSGAIDRQPALREWCLGLLKEKAHTTAEHLHQTLCAAFRNKLIEMDDGAGGKVMQPAQLPSARSVSYWLAAYKRDQHAAHSKNSNPDAFRSHYQVAFGSRSEGIVRLNQRWEMDASPVDVMTTDGRRVVIAVIDVGPRRGKLLVSKTPTAVANGLLVRRAMIAWGVPEVLKTDNGKDYTARHLEVACAGLGIRHELCDPFSPDQKPHVERFIGTFQHDLMELCAGYIGHSVADVQAIRNRKSFAERQSGVKTIEIRLSAARLQEICDQWCDVVYAHRPHDGLKGKSPAQVAAEWTEPVRRIQNERALDVLLAEAPDSRTREVRKKGILVGGLYYIAPELGACIKDTVQVFHDPDGDAGRLIIYSEDAEFICVAECPEITGISRAEVAAKAHVVQKAFIADATAEAKAAARRFKNMDLAQLIIDDAVARYDNVVVMPRASVPHQTPALIQAARAAARLSDMAPSSRRAAPKQITLSEADQAGLAQMVAEFTGNVVPLFKVPDDQHPYERFAWHVKLTADAARGEEIPEEWQSWFSSYGATAEYRSTAEMFEEFPSLTVEMYAKDLDLDAWRARKAAAL